MKKILLFLLLLIPINALAYGISDYRIDAVVEENGDLTVIEAFKMNGEFNGMERIINFRSNNSDKYNGSAIILDKIMGFDYDKNIALTDIDGDLFREVSVASKGTYGVYTVTSDSYGKTYLIYNPDNYKKAFYIKYTIKNMAISYNDIGELGWNIFTELSESVKKLTVTVHIPNNKELLRVWGHGPLYGESKIIDNNTIQLTVDGLEANEAIDVRLAFDKEAISKSTKTYNNNILETIIEEETKKADDANKVRTKSRTYLYTITAVSGLWIIGLFYIFIRVYKKYDKEYKSQFNNEYYRDFPSDIGPEIVGYLIRKHVNNDDLSAGILNLIYKKAISFEEIPNDKKDYIFKKNAGTFSLTKVEEKLMKFLFENEEVITLSGLKKKAKKNYEEFISLYTDWKDEATSEGEKQEFYENNGKVKIKSILYCILGGVMGFFFFSIPSYYSLDLIMIVLAIIFLFYFILFQRRTTKGNEEYHKWMALKRFMNEFGRMEEKELPEVKLWEKYLVYAVTFGIADKLQKVMKLKIDEMQKNGTLSNTTYNYIYFNNMMHFNRVINNSVNTAVSSAISAKTAASSNSSGSGFGGGFSGGGGSFGGGGGGGRF